MRPLGPRGLSLMAATMAAVAAGAPAAAAAAEPLAPLAPTLEAASRLATLQGLRSAPRPALFPVRGRVDFGERDSRYGASRGGHVHEGQDLFATAGTPLVAIRGGRVVETGNDGGRGNYVAIWSHDARRTFVYLHMLHGSRVRVDERVQTGQRVGSVGCTGSCWGDHLHLEVRRGKGTTGRSLDPLPLLRRLAARRARPE